MTGRKPPVPNPARRMLLRGATALAAGALVGPGNAQAAKKNDPRRLPVQAGDILCYPSWEEDSGDLRLDGLAVGAAPVLAYPRDPVSGTVRERSRLNQILVLRFAPADIPASMQDYAAEGVLAYSGLCTHTACGVSEWDADNRHLLCPCHGSTFDPLQRGRRITGPAPRSLPVLPLSLDNNHLVVAGPFTAKVGANA